MANWDHFHCNAVMQRRIGVSNYFPTNKCFRKTEKNIQNIRTQKEMFAWQLPACPKCSIGLLIGAGRKRGRRRKRGGWRFAVEVAVSVNAHGWQLHTISPRAADLLLRTMEPRAQYNLGVEAREPLKCVQLRALQRKLTSPAISYSFQF